jgi:hypothetical protein
MAHVEATRHLWVTPDALWAAVADLPNWDKWLTPHARWLAEPPAALTPGATLISKVVVLGMSNKITWHVTAVDAPSRLAMSGCGMAGVRCRFEVNITQAEEGSMFCVSGDFHGELIKGALGTAVAEDGAQQLNRAMQRLEALAATA